MDMAAAHRRLVDHADVVRVVTQHATSIDQQRWDRFAACFADTVWLDIPVTAGWVPMRRSHLVDVVTRLYARLHATQHISANHQITVSGDEATCVSTLNATHHLADDGSGGGLQREVGYYEYRLVRADGWRIDRCRLTVSWVEGDTEGFRRVQAAAGMGADHA